MIYDIYIYICRFCYIMHGPSKRCSFWVDQPFRLVRPRTVAAKDQQFLVAAGMVKKCWSCLKNPKKCAVQ